MPKLTSRIRRAATRAAEEIELRVLAAEGRRSLKSKAATVKRVAKNALKAGLIAGAIAATSSVLRDRKKRRALKA